MILHSVILSLLFFVVFLNGEKREEEERVPGLSDSGASLRCLFLSDSAMPLFKGKKERHLMGSDKLPQVLLLTEQLSTMHTQQIWVFIGKSQGWQLGHLNSFFVFSLSLLSCLSLA